MIGGHCECVNLFKQFVINIRHMIGAVIGAGLGLLGGLKSSNDQKKAQAAAREEEAKKAARWQAWYDRMYNQDANQTIAGQAANNRFRETARELIREMNGGVGAGDNSDYAKQAMTDSLNKAAGEMQTDLAIEQERRRDAIENQYMRAMDAHNDAVAQQRIEDAKGSNEFGVWANAIGTGIMGADQDSHSETGSGIIEQLFKKRAKKQVGDSGIFENYDKSMAMARIIDQNRPK